MHALILHYHFKFTELFKKVFSLYPLELEMYFCSECFIQFVVGCLTWQIGFNLNGTTFPNKFCGTFVSCTVKTSKLGQIYQTLFFPNSVQYSVLSQGWPLHEEFCYLLANSEKPSYVQFIKKVFAQGLIGHLGLILIKK